MADPSRFIKFEVIQNPLSSYSEDPLYIESGEVLSMDMVSFSAKQLVFQLKFSNPLYISLDSLNRDSLRVTILDETTFISAVDFITTARKMSTSTLVMFRQLSDDIKGTVASMEKGSEAANSFATASLPLNILLGVSLKYLWGMVNTLQFVIFMD